MSGAAFELVAIRLKAHESQVFKGVRDVLDLGLADARNLVTGLPKTIRSGLSREAADSLAAQLREVGLEVEVRPETIASPTTAGGQPTRHGGTPHEGNPGVPGEGATSVSSFPEDIERRISTDFRGETAPQARALLHASCRKAEESSPRLVRAILFLSKGDLQKMVENISLAETDFRDILYYAEYRGQGTGNPVRIRDFDKAFGSHELPDGDQQGPGKKE